MGRRNFFEEQRVIGFCNCSYVKNVIVNSLKGKIVGFPLYLSHFGNWIVTAKEYSETYPL